MPSPLLIVSILLAISLAGNGLLSKLYVSAKEDAASEKQARLDFVEGVKAIGEKQEKETAAKIAKANKDKEQADADNAKTRSDLAGVYAAYRSLRDQRNRAGSSILPAAAPGAASPESITFDRSGLDRALSGFDAGVTGLLESGDKAIADLNTARAWAQR